ncbi:MAG: polymerase [Fibrobacterota bacterium]|jgi:DNA polymerase-4
MNTPIAKDISLAVDRPSRRHAVFHLPEATARLLEGARPELQQRLFVLIDPNDSARAGEVGLAARSCGIRPGQALWELQRQHKDLLILHLPEAFYANMRERLSQIFLNQAPEVIEHSLGEWELDLTGCERLVQGRWEEWCAKLHTILQTEMGIQGHLALAMRRSTARMLARATESTIICPAGEEAKHLGTLPLEVIPELPELLRQKFLRHEMRTLGDLARMPRHLMSRRFGPEGEKLCAMARGMDITPILPAFVPTPPEDALDLFAPAAVLEPETARPTRKAGKGRWQETRRLAA